MASNSFGNIFRITTWGESHGKAMGVVIDGCPAGLEISKEEIDHALFLRAPGKNGFTSPRQEEDKVEILSGYFEGKTTGAPISLLIPNKDSDSTKYEPIKNLLRPGHANYTYLEKYGLFDYPGGGRASARETVCRVAAGSIAKKLLNFFGIDLIAYLKQVGSIVAACNPENALLTRNSIHQNPLFCPDPIATNEMVTLIEKTKNEGDSLGGIVEFVISPILPGLGDPIYEKLEANLAHAMLSIPAAKGFDSGTGFNSILMQGSKHNDAFYNENGRIKTSTNHAGGILGGISNGMPIIGRVIFKPTSSIMKAQNTLSISGEKTEFKLPEGSRHDPCVAIRAIPVVEAMAALVIADALLMNRCAKL